jgi:hypothetical protein
LFSFGQRNFFSFPIDVGPMAWSLAAWINNDL